MYANADIKELVDVVNYAHKHKAKVYVVTNILCHNNMVPGFIKYLKADEFEKKRIFITQERENVAAQYSVKPAFKHRGIFEPRQTVICGNI